MKHTIILLISLFLISCNFKRDPAPYPYDASINPIRKEVGLREIDSTFYNFDGGSTFLDAKKGYANRIIKPKSNDNYDEEIKKPRYYRKYIHIDKKIGKINAEDDVFRSGRYKPGLDVTFFETLIYRYVYNEFDNSQNSDGWFIPEKHYKKGWHYIYEYPTILDVTASNRPDLTYYKLDVKFVSKQEADSILSSWNLNRYR